MFSKYILTPVATGFLAYSAAGNALADDVADPTLRVGAKLPGLQAESLAGEA